MIRFGFIILVLSLMTLPSVTHGQVAADRFRSLLRQNGGFTDEDFVQVDKGEAVVKPLPAKDKNEVAVCGVVRVNAGADLTMAAFAASLAQTNNKSILAKGKFSDPPVIDDLGKLKLDKDDIKDLKKCKVGDCKVNLSAAMIARFQNEVDWSSADAADDANELFQQILFDYVSDYISRGNDALIQYDSRPRKLVLQDENEILLDKALLVGELAPELITYFRQLPKGTLSGIERSLDWSSVTFGLQPIIAVTDTVKYSPTGGAAEFLIATRQVYASRYSDSSMVFSMLVRTTGQGREDTYIVFTNRSRSESLRGLFGGFKRSLAGGEAVTRIKDILVRARERIEAPPDHGTSEERPIPMTTLDLILEWLNSTWTWVVFAAVAGTLLVMVYRYRRSG